MDQRKADKDEEELNSQVKEWRAKIALYKAEADKAGARLRLKAAKRLKLCSTSKQRLQDEGKTKLLESNLKVYGKNKVNTKTTIGQKKYGGFYG